MERKVISDIVKNGLNDLSAIINEAPSPPTLQSARFSRKKTGDEVIMLDLLADLNTDDGEKGKMNKLSPRGSQRFGRASSALQDALDNLDLGDQESSTDIKTSADNSVEEEDLFDLLGDDQI